MSGAGRLPRLTLRQAVLLLLLVVLIPAIVIEGMVYYRWYDTRISVELNANLEMARAAAAVTRSLISSIHRQGEAIGSSLLLPAPSTKEQIDRLLKINVEQYESIAALSVADLEGVIIASSMARGVGLRIADRPYFQAIKSGAKKWVVSDLIAEHVTGKPAFVVAVGIRDEEALRYVFIAAADPAKAGDILKLGRIGQAGVVIYDSQGVPVMSEPDIPLKLKSFASDDRLLREALAGREAIGDTVSPVDERARVGAKIPIHGLGWVAEATRSREQAVQPVVRSFAISLGKIVLVIVGSAAAAFLVGHRIVGSVRRLHEYAIAVGRGEPDRELSTGGIVELADLGDAFRETTRKQRRVEEELRVSEQRYRGLVEASPQAVFVDRGGRIAFANQAALELFGATAAQELLGKSHFDLFQPDCHPVMRERMRMLREGRPAPLIEQKILRLDGVMRDVEVAASSFVDGEGPATQVILHDVTDRKRAEEQISLLARFPAENPNPVLRVTRDCILVYANGAAGSLLSAWGCGVGERVPDDVRHLVVDALALGQRSEVEVPAADRTLWLSLAPVVDGGYVNIYARDITDRKRAEQLLRESQADLNRAQAVARTGSWRLDVRRNVLLWSDENHRIFGIPRETPLTYETFLAAVHPEDREYVHRKWTAALRGEPYDIEHRVMVDGTVKWVREKAELEFDEDGVLQGGFGTTQDITDRKQAEEALQASERRLAETLASISDAFVALDREWRYTYVNDQAERMLRKSREEMLGRTVWDAFPQSVGTDFERHFRRAVEEDATVRFEAFYPPLNAWFECACYPSPVGLSIYFRDVGDRKRAESEIRKLSRAVEQSPAAVVITDTTGRIEYVNPQFARVTGYSSEEAVGKNPRILRSDHTPSVTFEQMWTTIKAGGEWHGEFCNRKKNGELYWESASVSPITEGDGRITHFVAIKIDITDRKRAEEKLRETRDYLESLFNYANAPIIVWDSAFRITRFNRAFERLTGRTAHDVLGQPLDILFPEARREEALAHIWNALAGERWEVVEIPIVHVDGTVRTVLWNSATLYASDGKTVVATIAQGQDITDRKQAAEALRHSNLRQKLLAETASELLMSDAPQDVVESLCRKVLTYLDCQAFFNYLVNEDTGRLELNACAGVPDEAVRQIQWLDFGTAVCGCVARDGRQIVAENIPETSDPRTDLVRSFGIKAYACHPLLSQGKVVGTLSFGTRTRTSFAPDELALMKAVADHVAIAIERKRAVETLRRTADDLARSNKDLEQFAYVASHDLQEPLRTVAGYLQLIERRYASKLDKDAEEFIAFAVEGSLRLQQLINDLLAYSRLGTRGRPFGSMDCDQVLRDVLGALAGLIRENHAAVTHDPLPTIWGDAPQIRQLFQNLIANAIKFRGQEPPRIHVSARREGGVWRFSVRDNGIGMEPQYFERVFVVFQRLHTRARYPGTGIGLAICKKIVDRHGGRIWVESEMGKGSTFYFTLSGGAT